MLCAMQARLHLAELGLQVLQGYLAIGALIALAFIVLLPRVEPSSVGASLGARIAFLPGAAMLWPYVLVRTLRGLRNKPTPKHE
jgi:hypothetical protein